MFKRRVGEPCEEIIWYDIMCDGCQFEHKCFPENFEDYNYGEELE